MGLRIAASSCLRRTGACTQLAVLACLHHRAAAASLFLAHGQQHCPTERRERGFQKEAGRDGGNISVKLLRVFNKLDLSNIVVWLGFFLIFGKNFWQGAQSCDHIAILAMGCIRGKACGRSWNREELGETDIPIF